jgi:hypothetical protein
MEMKFRKGVLYYFEGGRNFDTGCPELLNAFTMQQGTAKKRSELKVLLTCTKL